jgi:hypothetical protein
MYSFKIDGNTNRFLLQVMGILVHIISEKVHMGMAEHWYEYRSFSVQKKES